MSKYKLCPECGKKYPPNITECPVCDYDLTGIVALDEASEESSNKADPSGMDSHTVKDVEERKLVKICENCGAVNSVQERKCNNPNCREDLASIVPQYDSGDISNSGDNSIAKETDKYILASLDEKYAFRIPDGLTVIGRESAMEEYLNDKKYVSRKHAELMVEANKLWVKHISNTNPTFVNNEKIGNAYVELSDGDIIGFGGKEINGATQPDAAYFLVRIGQCI